MRFDYDPETDSLYIKLADRPGREASEVAPGVVVDYDASGQAVGIDIEHASQVSGFLSMLVSGAVRQTSAAIQA
jgi:uncharacterized protein YuzE